MSDSLRGFGGSEVFTLVVGSEQEILSVPKDILTRIPHFRVALSSGEFSESKSRRFELPDDSPRTIADLIYFTHSGRIPEVHESDGYLCSTYIQTWIIADKYQAETLANGMIDKLVIFYGNRAIHDSHIVILREAGLSDSLLGNLLMRVLAWDLSHASFRSDCTFKGQEFDKLTKAEMETVLEIIMNQAMEDKDPLNAAQGAPCTLHTHTLTPVCDSPSES